MSPATRQDSLARMQALQAELKSLRMQMKVKPPTKKLERERVRETRTIAPGVAVRTLEGSMYTCIIRALAVLGRLAEHDKFFESFKGAPSSAAAEKLMLKIGVARTAMIAAVRADPEFKAYAKRRTLQYKRLASRGYLKYSDVQKNPRIWVSGKWVGDIQEAISILSGASTPEKAEAGKNQQILSRAGLLFYKFKRDGETYCVLYKERWYPTLLKARKLLGLK